jgi:hypothetical protein
MVAGDAADCWHSVQGEDLKDAHCAASQPVRAPAAEAGLLTGAACCRVAPRSGDGLCGTPRATLPGKSCGCRNGR